jgi:hypothetical protein
LRIFIDQIAEIDELLAGDAAHIAIPAAPGTRENAVDQVKSSQNASSLA